MSGFLPGAYAWQATGLDGKVLSAATGHVASRLNMKSLSSFSLRPRMGVPAPKVLSEPGVDLFGLAVSSIGVVLVTSPSCFTRLELLRRTEGSIGSTARTEKLFLGLHRNGHTVWVHVTKGLIEITPRHP